MRPCVFNACCIEIACDDGGVAVKVLRLMAVFYLMERRCLLQLLTKQIEGLFDDSEQQNVVDLQIVFQFSPTLRFSNSMQTCSSLKPQRQSALDLISHSTVGTFCQAFPAYRTAGW
jgi:hypothetical protein